MSTLGNKRVELFDMGTGTSEMTADENVQVASGGITYPVFLYSHFSHLMTYMEKKCYETLLCASRH